MSLPGLHVDRVVGEHRERRHAVLAIVLVLIVAPQEDEVRLESIQLGPGLPEVVNEVAPVLVGVARAFIGAPLLAHRGMPARGRPQALGQERIGEQQLDPAAHVALIAERRIVGDAEPEDLSHHRPSYLKESWTRVRKATTFPPSTLMSILATSAMRRSRSDLEAVSTALRAASSQDVVLVPMTSITRYTPSLLPF